LTTPQGELKQPKQKERRNAWIQAMVW
jgi:hypothetical protein